LHAAFLASSSYLKSSLDERHAVIYHWCYEQAKAFNVDYPTILRYKNAASEFAYWMPLNPFMSIVEEFGIFHVPPGLL